MRKLALLFAVGLASNPAPVSITVTPRAVMAGGFLHLTCRVQHDSRNRLLEWGIVDIASSQRDLHGEDSPTTFGPFDYQHVGCDAGPAYCAVFRNDGTADRAVGRFEVAGCDGGLHDTRSVGQGR